MSNCPRLNTLHPGTDHRRGRKTYTPFLPLPQPVDKPLSEEGIEILKQAASVAMRQAPLTVVNTTFLPPSGNKQDFVSFAPYFWPNLADPKGMYIRKDGKTNPDVKESTDEADLRAFAESIRILLLGHVHLPGDKYAEHAARLIETWCVDGETRMEPSFLYGQIVRGGGGIPEGRMEGIIAARYLTFLPEVLAHPAMQEIIPKTVLEGAWAWVREWRRWLQTHPLALAAASTGNNHASYYYAQVIALLRGLGDDGSARQAYDRFHPVCLRQIAADGTQPLEMARTRPFHYALFNLQALAWIARVGEGPPALYNLWAEGDRAILRATRAILEMPCPPEDALDWRMLLLTVGRVYGEQDLLEVAASIEIITVNPIHDLTCVWS